MQTTAFLGVAHIHTPNFIKLINQREDVRAKAVYDHDGERAQKAAESLDAGFCGSSQADLETILNDPEITSVVICSETVQHRDLAVRAARAGKHLFVEKPLAIDEVDADAIEKAVAEAGVQFQTGFMLRSTPQMQFIKREVEAGHLGAITRARHTNGHGGALGGWFDTEWRWIADKEQAGGGGFADLGAHSLDIILWTLSKTCGNVEKAIGMLGAQTGRYGEIDEYGSGLLQFESGAIAVVEASWVDQKLRSQVEVFGTEGQIQFNPPTGELFYYSKHVDGAEGGLWTDLPEQQPHAFLLFWDKLEGKEIGIPLISVQEAAAESRIMSRLYNSVA